jgi:hypothetical protein
MKMSFLKLFNLPNFDCFTEHGTGALITPHRGGCLVITPKPPSDTTKKLTIKEYLDNLQHEYEFNNRDYAKICIYLYHVHGIAQDNHVTGYADNIIMEQLANIEQGLGVESVPTYDYYPKQGTQEKITLEEEEW